ncbi:hypothetical protein [Sulfobacillus thermosulfidooxidans]|uniref:hypothetical protein n=1 Tax=Sulfobacillus thermosulfidooxidans TaxID=28034 RepID=UPI0006B5E476|nr:hypothetical protein [Sulfobacillus thermosulfidooxidans]
MISNEQIQDFIGPDIKNLPLSSLPDAGYEDVRFSLRKAGLSGRILTLKMWEDIHEDVPSIGYFSRLRALKELHIGKAVGPLAYIEPYYKLVTYVPPDHLEPVREALWEAGAGHIGHYSRCSYTSQGTGTFWPEHGTHPFLGHIGQLNAEEEMRLEVIVPKWYQERVENALLVIHPYEEVAFDWIALKNRLGLAQAYEDGDGAWWFIEETPELVRAIMLHHPPTIHCEKVSWETRLKLAEQHIVVDMKQPGELLYPGLHKLWGDKKRLWE